MSQSQGGSVKEEKTKCKACLDLIPIGARKCSRCGSFQNWQAKFPLTESILALLIALVSVVLLGIPIVKSALQPDDSEITLTYIDRSDVSIPIIASNKGNRPGVMEPVAGLLVTTKGSGDRPAQTHALLANVAEGTRANLLIPENTSKQFFFFVNSPQYAPDVFQKLADDLQSIDSLRKCTVTVMYLDFTGKTRKFDVVIFDADAVRKATEENRVESLFERIMGVTGCIIKIPKPVREKYKLPLG